MKTNYGEHNEGGRDQQGKWHHNQFRVNCIAKSTHHRDKEIKKKLGITAYDDN